jgi:hypothetical protein
MTNPSFGETWLGFVAVLVRRGFLENVRGRQVLEQVGSQFHRSYNSPLAGQIQGRIGMPGEEAAFAEVEGPNDVLVGGRCPGPFFEFVSCHGRICPFTS